MIEGKGHTCLVFLIASLNVHRLDGLKEVSLFLGHLRVETTALGYLAVVVDIWRVVVSTYAPVGFECLFDDLMAHEADVKPVTSLIENLSHA